MIIDKKPNLVCYCHAPVSPNVQGLHLSLFRLIDAFKIEYNVHVVSRSLECYEFYQKRFKSLYPDVNFVSVPNNVSENIYTVGLLEDVIDREVGRVDYAFWFSAGLVSVTPEKMMKYAYTDIKNGFFKDPENGSKILLQNNQDGPVIYEAELLHSVLKHNPVFNYRVVDYTEPHIHEITGYPMKLLSFYPNKDLGHIKFHDTEMLHFTQTHTGSHDKTTEFIFGYTVEIPERAYLSDFCFEHIKTNDQFKLYVKDKYFSKYSPINTALSTDEYFEALKHTKFTFNAPSTDPNEVSMYRIYEALARRCIPIFMKTVQYKKAFDDEVNSIIEQYLIYDEDKYPVFNDFVATLDYDMLIEKLLNCRMFVECMDSEKMTKLVLEEIR